MSLENAPQITSKRQTLGMGLLKCLVCGEGVPIGVEVWIGRDDDGDDAVFTDPNVMDLELHMLAHDLGGDLQPETCVRCGDDEPAEGQERCVECLERYGET